MGKEGLDLLINTVSIKVNLFPCGIEVYVSVFLFLFVCVRCSYYLCIYVIENQSLCNFVLVVVGQSASSNISQRS